MAVTISWSLENLDYINNSDKIVSRAHWLCHAYDEVDGERYAADDLGAVMLDEITAGADGFIAYASLTEEKCFEWVYAKIDKDDIESRLQEAVAKQTSPALKSGKPW